MRPTTAVLVLILGAAISATAANATRPNLVLIMADDLGYECLGVNGSLSYRTPHLDSLASGGMRFTYAFSQPICTPSRVQIMTGIYNHRNYVRFGLLHPNAVTFANLLRQAGYATCITGKWQLKNGFDGPDRFGFDEYCLWQLTRRPNRYPNPGLEINGREVDFKNGEYGPDIVSDYACDFIEREAGGERPFFLYYPMILPHWPFEPTPDSPEWDPTFRRDDPREISRKGWENHFFDDMVAYTDKLVGKIVAKLEEAGVRDRTLVLFTGDNGTYTGITSMTASGPIQGGKGTTTNAGTHVPLIASWPGSVPAGHVNHDLIDFSDFLPTLAEFAQAEIPTAPTLDGRSFAPQLLGQPGHPRQWTYCWYERNGKRPAAREFARTHRYKYYADGRFFNLARDPLEENPLNPADHLQSLDILRGVLQNKMAEGSLW